MPKTIVPEADAVDPAPTPTIGRTALALRESTPVSPDWLIPGILAASMTTEINGREKVGKGWFEAFLLGRLEHEQSTFFGPTRAATALIYTEEPDHSLREKLDTFDIREGYVVYQWELARLTWPDKVAWLVENAIRLGHTVVFIDNISAATGTDDENGVELARKVEPLAQKAKEFQLAVLYDRHQRKTAGKVEDLARGGTALAGAVDQIVAMGKAEGRERRLHSWGRLWTHNWERTVELTEDHTDYLDLGAGDWRDEMVLSRDEWTIAEYAEAANSSREWARQYLEGSPLVMRRHMRRGNANVYDVIKDTPPPLD